MGIKEGTCCDQHWVLYVSDESLNSTPETNTVWYANNLNLNKNLGEKKPQVIETEHRMMVVARGWQVEEMGKWFCSKGTIFQL